MKPLFGALVCLLAILSMGRITEAADIAPAVNEEPVYVTTFIEVMPPAAAQAATVLRAYREAARKEQGALQTEVYQEVGTPSRFVAKELWQTPQAFDSHMKAAANAELFDRLRPIQYGPPDVRTHILYFPATADAVGSAGNPPANSVFILSHLDVTPPQVPTLLELMKPLAENSIKEAGVRTYEILRQGPRGNHFRLFEVWASEKAWEDHNLASHTQTFRNKVEPFLGTPYDQRKYIVLN